LQRKKENQRGEKERENTNAIKREDRIIDLPDKKEVELYYEGTNAAN
jgi:hypothetical protein